MELTVGATNQKADIFTSFSVSLLSRVFVCYWETGWAHALRVCSVGSTDGLYVRITGDLETRHLSVRRKDQGRVYGSGVFYPRPLELLERHSERLQRLPMGRESSAFSLQIFTFLPQVLEERLNSLEGEVNMAVCLVAPKASYLFQP